MNIIPDHHPLYLIGDYHCNTERLIEKLELIKGPATLIMLGDYSTYDAQGISDLATLLSGYDVHSYLLRGNHDNPKYWQDRSLADILETPAFKLLEDVDSLQWRQLKITTVSGAISVDRSCIRTDNGKCWPAQEAIDTNVIAKVLELGHADILLSHTGIVEGVTAKNQFVESFASTDDTLIDDIKAERLLIQKIMIASNCQKHYFGHFHQSWQGEQFGVQTRCLDICELAQL